MTRSGRAAGSIAAWASSRRPRFLWGLFVETLSRIRLSPSSNLRRTSAAGSGRSVALTPSPCGTTSTFAAGTWRRETTSSRVLFEMAITRSERRTAAGTSTRIPSPRRPKCASGTIM